ncbi:V-set domain-containing T-cell activation inhibitor 1 B7 -like protein 4 [Channa argus]|uniref:V-set domain-containing T-cell activation inhibitor 1 B7-like protein 4 n=1 Tax=Channa argus TaxID=215402 RepID=A0A6G1Q7G4_CHAAH|nr:V-set domain-containing T-cell activation inhibitor 1 B7 -like protein 4 [Channa argus]KAK2899603.1 hypothetical protein Q8A73_012732 [Channa argus]
MTDPKTNEPHLIYFLAAVLQLSIYPRIMIFMSLGLLFASTSAQVQEPEVIGSHEPIGAVAGEDVILPCHLEPPFDVTTLRVEWKFNESFVHVYRSRMDDTALQDKKFKNRTFLFHNEMHTGNISLKLTNVSLTDAGKYTCYVPKLQSQVKRGYINLSVDSMDEGKKRQQEATTEAPKNNETTQHNVQYTGTIIAVVLGVVMLLVIIAFAIWQKQRNRDGHNRSNTVNTQEQVPLNTTNNTNNADNVDNEDNAVNAENTNESGQH